MKKKFIIALSCALCICLNLVTSTACFGMFNTSNNKNPEVIDIYNMYVVSAEEKGETPLSYEEWLTTIKGEKGDKGDVGEDGKTPRVEIKDGYWYINGENTGVKAEGKDGVNGANGNVDLTDMVKFTNVVDNGNTNLFVGKYGTLTQEDGWLKLTPTENAYPRITYTINEELQVGRKYLLAFSLKYDLGEITANSFVPRLIEESNTIKGDVLLKSLTGKRNYSANRCSYVFECTTTAQFKQIEFVMGYAKAKDTVGTWFAIKDINFIDITDMGEILEPYHLGNLIVAQYDGLVTGTQYVNLSEEIAYPLKNHNILFLGDSIFGNYNIPKYVQDITKATCVNGAIGGATAFNNKNDIYSLVNISKAIKTGDWSQYERSNKDAVTRLKELDFTTINDIVIEIGTNDWRRNCEIGTDDSTDDLTFKGALNTIIDNILSVYPEIDIYFLTPLYRTEFNANTLPNGEGDYLYEFANAVTDIAKRHCLPCYDMYHAGGINEYNSTKYLIDGTHPTPIMRMKIAKIISNLLIY